MPSQMTEIQMAKNVWHLRHASSIAKEFLINEMTEEEKTNLFALSDKDVHLFLDALLHSEIQAYILLNRNQTTGSFEKLIEVYRKNKPALLVALSDPLLLETMDFDVLTVDEIMDRIKDKKTSNFTLNPNYTLGKIYLEQKKVEKACQCFMSIPEDDPCYANSMINAGTINIELKKFEDAKELFEKAKEAEKKAADKKAEKATNEGVKTEPDYTKMHFVENIISQIISTNTAETSALPSKIIPKKACKTPLSERNKAFIKELNDEYSRIKKISYGEQNLKDDKLSILNFYKECVEKINPQNLSEFLKEINNCPLLSTKELRSKLQKENNVILAEIQLHHKSEEYVNKNVLDLLSQKRFEFKFHIGKHKFEFFTDAKPKSQRCIQKYSGLIAEQNGPVVTTVAFASN